MREGSRLGRICPPRLVGHVASDCAGLFSFLFLCFFCAGRIVHNFFARDPEDDGTLAWLKHLVGNALQVGGGGMVVAFQVLRQITRIAEIMVVLVEAVGHAPETAEPFQLLNDLRFNYIASAIQLGLGGPFRPQFCKFFIDGLFQILRFDARLRRSLDLKYRAQDQGLALHLYVLRNLFLINQPFV